MGFLFDSLLVEIVAVFLTTIIGISTYIKWSFSYWEKKNLPHLKPAFPWGTMENPFTRKKSFGCWLKLNYDELKAQGHKHGGIYNFSAPVYMPIHPEYIKNVMQRDFHHFIDRGIYYNERDDPLSAHLFAVGGEKWRNLRTKLTPTFTSGKMKMMFETLVKCSYPMKEAMDDYCEKREAVDIKYIVSSFTIDVIGSTAFGLDCNSFKTPDAEFRKYGKKVFEFSTWQLVKLLVCMSNPKLGLLLRLTATPKDSAEFFMKVIRDTVNYREANNVVRKDMLQLLIELRNDQDGDDTRKHDGKSLTIEEIAAQAFVFFVAGFETSSTTMTFCLFELATNPAIQQKVREEINEVLAKHDGKITYEAMNEMKYMGQVIDETLRKYPPVPIITRKCVKDYKVPDTGVVIEKGTMAFISVFGIQRDPEYYPDPEKFDPHRFSEEQKKQRHPFTYLPFGEGPRICIGLRFGIMQTKVGLTVLLKNYNFFVNKKTKLPLEIDPKNISISAKGSIWLDAQNID